MAGHYRRGPAHARFPGLCTNSAPLSTESSQDTSARWQVSVDVNSQTLRGCVIERPRRREILTYIFLLFY
jgi:hypothetical protein